MEEPHKRAVSRGQVDEASPVEESGNIRNQDHKDHKDLSVGDSQIDEMRKESKESIKHFFQVTMIHSSSCCEFWQSVKDAWHGVDQLEVKVEALEANVSKIRESKEDVESQIEREIADHKSQMEKLERECHVANLEAERNRLLLDHVGTIVSSVSLSASLD